MTNETLVFPELDEVQQAAPAPAPAPAALVSTITKDRPLVIANVKDAAVDQLRAKEPELLALAERYRAVVYDVNTPKGLTEAKAARHDLRENGRFLIQKGRDKVKKLLNGAKTDVETEADRLISITQPTEDLLHTQIEARETVLAEEKAERDRLEAERVAAHQAQLAAIRDIAAKAKGIESARIANGIQQLEALEIDPEAWEEFAVEAANTKTETLAAMRALFDTTLAHEQELQRLEEQRLENERIATEQAAEAKRLKEEAEKLAAEQKAAADKLAADMAEFNRQKAEFEEKQRLAAAPAPVAAAEPEPKPEPVEPVVETLAPVEAEQPAPAPAVQTQELVEQPAPGVVRYTSFRPVAQAEPVAAVTESNVAMFKLGDFIKNIAPVEITADGLAQMGFTSVPGKNGAKMYRVSDYPLMCAALSKHLDQKACLKLAA